MPPGWGLRCRLRPPRAVRIALVWRLWPRARGAWRPRGSLPPDDRRAPLARTAVPSLPMCMLRSRSGSRAVPRGDPPLARPRRSH
eukprot:379318-Pleurochrysis_carterae.AAC.1